MNLSEAKKKLNDAGIYQLNKGETLRDALNHVEKGTPRKGYKIRASNGRLLTKNEIIHHENKAAFAKSFTPSEYLRDDEYEDAEEVYEDKREDKSVRGLLCRCYYCGISMRIDGWEGGVDYEDEQPEVHCDGCTNDAIMKLAM